MRGNDNQQQQDHYGFHLRFHEKSNRKNEGKEKQCRHMTENNFNGENQKEIGEGKYIYFMKENYFKIKTI